MTVTRTAIHLPAFAHANPIPVASRVGPLVTSGALTGRDPATGDMPPTLDAQLHRVFALIAEVMHAAGGSLDDIAKLTFHLRDYRDRDALNREWTAMFPGRDTMPARQVVAAELDGGALVHADLIAWIDDRGPE